MYHLWANIRVLLLLYASIEDPYLTLPYSRQPLLDSPLWLLVTGYRTRDDQASEFTLHFPHSI